MGSAKILCIESCAEYMDALTSMLEAAGYNVIPAATVRQGLSLFLRERIDGVLVEYDLPDGTGVTVRAEMKRAKPEIPILLFSGIGSQTPFLLRFFDSYLRHGGRPELALRDLDR
jgi:DNA-binding response OmpR family regulator